MNEFTRQYQERQRQAALSQPSESDPRTQLPKQTGEVYDAATREWVNVWNGNRRRDGATWEPEAAIQPAMNGHRVSVELPAWPGPLLLTYLPPHHRFRLIDRLESGVYSVRTPSD